MLWTTLGLCLICHYFGPLNFHNEKKNCLHHGYEKYTHTHTSTQTQTQTHTQTHTHTDKDTDTDPHTHIDQTRDFLLS